MNKLFIIVVLTFFMTSFADNLSPLSPWPAGDRDNHDLEYNPEDTPRLIPLKEFNKHYRSLRNRLGKKLKKFPFKKKDRNRARGENYTLVDSQSPVKNQGGRGQCHNFAVTASIEYALWVGEDKAHNFSEQCNAWKFYKECTACNGKPTGSSDGGWPSKEISFIYKKFMKFEADYPYSSDASICKNNYNDMPTYKFEDIHIYRQSRDMIKVAIDKNFVVITSTKWKSDGWNNYGEYPYKDSYKRCTTKTCGGHAILIVGYDDDYYAPGKGGYIFKNSWSPYWGKKKGDKPAGYGIFPYGYLKKFGKKYVAVSHKKVYPDPLPTVGCTKRR